MGQPEVSRHVPGFLQDDTMRHEQRIDVARHAGGIIGQRHGRAAYHEHVGDHAPLDQALAKGGERPLELYPIEEDALRLGHAASRSAADR